MKRNRLYRIMMFLPLGILFIALFGFAVMSLWNWLMPELFGLKAIGYWQAMGLMVLSRIFFGGFGRGGNGRSLHGNLAQDIGPILLHRRARPLANGSESLFDATQGGAPIFGGRNHPLGDRRQRSARLYIREGV